VSADALETGIRVAIFRIAKSPKKWRKKLAFSTQNCAIFSATISIALVFEKKAMFIAENWQKSS
jgi:hypothetical protein